MKNHVLAFLLSLKAILNRVYYDIIKEVVVLISSGVILALFIYIFDDFLNSQVAAVSVDFRDNFAHWIKVASLALIPLLLMRSIYADFNERESFPSLISHLGQEKTKPFYALRYSFFTLVYIAIGATFFHYILLDTAAIRILAFILGVTLLAFSLLLPKLRQFAESRTEMSQSKTISNKVDKKIIALIKWRMNILINKNKITAICVAISFVFATLAYIAGGKGIPIFVGACAGFAGSLFLAFAVCFAVAEDLQLSWAEKALGLTHAEFIRTYEFICWGSGLIYGTGIGLLYYLASMHHSPALTTAHLQIIFATMVPVCICPSVLFHIDAKKPFVTSISVFLVGAFLSTAILAHILSICLLPLVIYYGNLNQMNRFYRA